MKILLSGFFIQIFFISILLGQSYSPSKAKQFQSLTGEVYLLSLFIDTEAGDWEYEEMDFFYEEYLKSQDWIKEQAAIYQRSVSFNNDFFLDNKEVIYLKSVWRDHASELLNQVMYKLRYEGVADFLEQTGFDFEKNKLKIVFFVKSNDRSHAIDYWSQKHVDVAVVYFRSTFGQLTDQYVISHEMLHQFGAWDLYNGESQSPEKAAKAFELYPHSIMINTHRKQSLLEVDELTAWRVGWIDDFKEDYIYFKPERRNPAQENAKKKNTIRFDLKKKKDKG